MFFKATEELKKIRKFVDYRKMDLYDLPGIAQKIDDISYQLTTIINDMIQVDKTLNKVEKELKCPTIENSGSH